MYVRMYVTTLSWFHVPTHPPTHLPTYRHRSTALSVNIFRPFSDQREVQSEVRPKKTKMMTMASETKPTAIL